MGLPVGPAAADCEGGALLVPPRARKVPGRGLPGQQCVGLHLLQLLQGRSGGLVVEQPRVLRVPSLAEHSVIRQWLRLGSDKCSEAWSISCCTGCYAPRIRDVMACESVQHCWSSLVVPLSWTVPFRRASSVQSIISH